MLCAIPVFIPVLSPYIFQAVYVAIQPTPSIAVSVCGVCVPVNTLEAFQDCHVLLIGKMFLAASEKELVINLPASRTWGTGINQLTNDAAC